MSITSEKKTETIKEFATKKYKRISKTKSISTPLPFLQQKMVYHLSKDLDTKIELKRNKKGKGKLIIPFNNDQDLERIIKMLKK